MASNSTKIEAHALYDEQFVCDYLGLHRQTISKLRRSGQLGYVALSQRTIRYKGSHLIAYLNSRSQGPTATVAK